MQDAPELQEARDKGGMGGPVRGPVVDGLRFGLLLSKRGWLIELPDPSCSRCLGVHLRSGRPGPAASAGWAAVWAERSRLAPGRVCDRKSVQLFPLFCIKMQGCGWVIRNWFWGFF